jgi:hypothetical protein
MDVFKCLTEQISIATANTVANANLVYIFNANTTGSSLVTVALGGSNTGSLQLPPLRSVVIEKKLAETVVGPTCFATKIAYKN